MSGSGTLIVSNGTNNAIIGGTNQYARGVYSTAMTGVVITVTGNIIANTGNTYQAHGLKVNGASLITINGNIVGGAYQEAIALYLLGASTVTVNGNITGGNSNAVNVSGIYIEAASTVTITGNATSGTYNECYAINNSSASAVITVIGNLVAGNTSAIRNNQAGAILKCTGPFLCSAAGLQAVYSPSLRWYDSRDSYFQIRTADLGAIRSLYTANHADSGSGQAAIADVRQGTVYGPSSELTGTCHVPAAASVLYGVSVDATTGTATLAAADIRAALGLASANLDMQLATKPSIDVVGGIVAALGV